MRITSWGLLLTAIACASPGTPPGGPVDTQAPQIVRIAPDSGKTNVKPREVIFQFDEVVSERPSGSPTLGGLFLISPRNGEAQADWHRSEIAVRPSRGFKPNTTYTINLLPGLSDLRGNSRNTGATTVFSTGPTIATGRITGTLFNWAEARVVARGLIEARPLNDTATVYVTATDSVGDFNLKNVPPAQYRVRGFSDDNNNRGMDPREPFDTMIVNLVDSSKFELLAFVHDSVGTRLANVSVRDSVTLELLFDNPLSVAAQITAAQIRIRGSDSTAIPIASVAAPAADTAITRPLTQNPTGTTAVTETSLTTRKPSRSPPLKSVIVRLSLPLRPKVTYKVRVTDVQNLIGVAKTSEREVTLPAPVAPPAAAKPPTGFIPAVPQPTPVKK
ncbi:MAG: Ig-like domain-containing protein [Gemmatimonadaceae bacterium]